MTYTTWIKRFRGFVQPIRPTGSPRRSMRRIRPCLEVLEDRVAPADNIFTVTTGALADDGVVGKQTLRWAIQQVNAGTGGDTINFNINGRGSVATIQLNPARGALPSITESVTIDGYSQNNGTVTGTPWVQIDGTNIIGRGLEIDAPSSIIQALAVFAFTGAGIRLGAHTGTTGDTVQACYIGTDASGSRPNGGNTADGIWITSGDNTIGGTVANTGNLITGNGGDGVNIDGTAAVRNFLGRNIIGQNSANTQTNGSSGVEIHNGAASNTVGGVTTTSVNDIWGNRSEGVRIDGSNNNLIAGNLIGVTPNGTAVANANNGIRVTNGSANNTIGGAASNYLGNVISGNTKNGIQLDGTNVTGNQILGNIIGLNPAGTAAAANGQNGVELDQAFQNTIGGSSASGTGNVISGNALDGILILGTSATKNKIAGDTIGLNSAGNAAIANGQNGVHLKEAVQNTIGGVADGERNVISGNTSNGVYVEGVNGDAIKNLILGNYIGTDVGGTVSLSNGSDGVYLNSAAQNTIGGVAANSFNVISGNADDGVLINGGSNNLLTGNIIGLNKNGTATLTGANPQSNGENGVEIMGSSGNTIGGVRTGAFGGGTFAGNIISGNGVSSATDANHNNGVIIGSQAANNLVQGNFIGTDKAGTSALGNVGDGVYVEVNAGSGNTLGGTAANQGNVISGNGFTAGVGWWGIDLQVAVTEDFNNIGKDVNGAALPNKRGGSAQNTYGTNDNHQ
jgi:hypothetical protein